jgi:hypothetical protein
MQTHTVTVWLLKEMNMGINETMKPLSFWGHFEETALETSFNSSNVSSTQTRQREEPDQRNVYVSAGTLTETRTREEADQDVGNKHYCAIPTRISCGTETQTFAREEPEQDVGNKQYCAIPTHISCGTKTLTEQREEHEQDESSNKHVAIPVNARAQT